MNEKPFKLPMHFGEALARLARVPKPADKQASKNIAKSVKKPDNKTGALDTRRVVGKVTAKSDKG